MNGDAIASGASVVAAVDYAMAAPHARIGTREVSAGIWPVVAQVPIIHRLGPRWATASRPSQTVAPAARCTDPDRC